MVIEMDALCEQCPWCARIMWDGLRPTPALSTYMELMDRSESKGCQDIGLPQTPTSVLGQPSQIRDDRAAGHAVAGCAKS